MAYVNIEIKVLVIYFRFIEHHKFKDIQDCTDRIFWVSYFHPKSTSINVFSPCHQTTFEHILGLMSATPPRVEALMFCSGCWSDSLTCLRCMKLWQLCCWLKKPDTLQRERWVIYNVSKTPNASSQSQGSYYVSLTGAFGWYPTVTDWQPSKHSCSSALCWSCYNTAGISQSRHHSGNHVIILHKYFSPQIVPE